MRQIKTVKANQDHVPKVFSEDISLESHQKAANYTEAKMKLSNVSALVDAALLIALTTDELCFDPRWTSELGLDRSLSCTQGCFFLDVLRSKKTLRNSALSFLLL